MDPVHYLQFLQHKKADIQTRYDEKHAFWVNQRLQWEKTRWFRWFGMKWEAPRRDWGYDEYRQLRIFLESDIPELEKWAAYRAKMGYEEMGDPPSKYLPMFKQAFYVWAEANGIPYPGPAPMV